jgi:hypothetical protein
LPFPCHFSLNKIVFTKKKKKLLKKKMAAPSSQLPSERVERKLRFEYTNNKFEFLLQDHIEVRDVEKGFRELLRTSQEAPKQRLRKTIETLRQLWAPNANADVWIRVMRASVLAPSSSFELVVTTKPNDEGGVDIFQITEEARRRRGARPALVCKIAQSIK